MDESVDESSVAALQETKQAGSDAPREPDQGEEEYVEEDQNPVAVAEESTIEPLPDVDEDATAEAEEDMGHPDPQPEATDLEEKPASDIVEPEPRKMMGRDATDNNVRSSPREAKAEELDQKEALVEKEEQSDELEPGVNAPDQQVPPTAVNREATATVKFLMPSGGVATLAFRLSTTLRELKEHFAHELKIPMSVILLAFDGRFAEDEKTLAELGVNPNGTVQLEMQSSDPVNTPIPVFHNRQTYHMPDVISVRVESDYGHIRDLVVEIQRAERRKPYMGGFRHKKTNVQYHNASAQTDAKPRPDDGIERRCRDTQTSNLKNQRQQVTKESSTQMVGIGVYVSNATDRLLSPKPYQTADEVVTIRLEAVVVLQKYWRRWLAVRLVANLRTDARKRSDWELKEEIRKRKAKEEQRRRELERRMNPRTAADFDHLFAHIETWKRGEEEAINTQLSGAERKAALCALLDQETAYIFAIDQKRAKVADDNKEKSTDGILSKAAASKSWTGPDGSTTHMDTPYTVRARELKDIYDNLRMKFLTTDERLDALLSLKHTVKEHDCKLTREIVSLVDREADLMLRGCTRLEGLRKRICTLFLQYVKTPTFNPEISRLLKVPQDPSVLRKDIYYCHSCCSYKPSLEFDLPSKGIAPRTCKKCKRIDNEGRRRQDFSKYKSILNELRRSEEEADDGSKMAFLLEEHDIRYIVEKIWAGVSIVSNWSDLYDLVLVRWDVHREWTPWNCVLLSRDEAAAHRKLEFKEESYSESVLEKIKMRHVLARKHFSKLPELAKAMAFSSMSVQNVDQAPLQGRSVRIQAQRVPPEAVTQTLLS